MARPKSSTPALRFHISGQSCCEINGRTYYLGKHGSPESLARYAVLIREYQANGLVVPNGLDSKALAQIGWDAIPVENKSREPITVKHAATVYREHISSTMDESNKERKRLMKLCDELIKHYGAMLVDDFGPRSLKEQRDRGLKLATLASTATDSLTQWFECSKQCVSDELASPTTWQRLKAVEPLRVGQTAAPETEPVKAVPIEHVRATAAFLSPVVKAMLRVHVATACDRASSVESDRATLIDLVSLDVSPCQAQDRWPRQDSSNTDHRRCAGCARRLSQSQVGCLLFFACGNSGMAQG